MDDTALSERKRRAQAAAVDAGRAFGLTIDEPVVLHDGFSVVVHLAPSPVVVRVPTVLPVGVALELSTAQQQRELDVVAWLDGAGLPVVRPSPLVHRKPVVRDGFSMTFWEKVEVDRDVVPDFIANAAHVAELHAALAPCPVELPFLWPMTAIEPALAELRKHPELGAPGDLDKAEREWSALGPILSSRAAFEARFPHVPVQPIHGDAPCYNVIATTSGVRHADFEHACLGTAEWDLAGFGPAIQGAYDAAATERGLRKLDPEVLRVMEAGRNLQLVACIPMAPQYPGLLEAIGPMLDAWRALPLIALLALVGCAGPPEPTPVAPAQTAPPQTAPPPSATPPLTVATESATPSAAPTGCVWTEEAPGVDDCTRIQKQLSPLPNIVGQTQALEQLLTATPTSSPDHATVLAHVAAVYLELACAARKECEAGAPTQGAVARAAHAQHVRLCERVLREHPDKLERARCASGTLR